ncbi:MAG: TonB family protein [Candidatus Eremiobacteraeota bacterium]|nr:TonB family protein [Candidatus Eremiobacteraeota bacterium]
MDASSDASIRKSLPSKGNTVTGRYTGQLVPPTCSQSNREARALTRIAPEFPEISRQRGLRGTAVVKIDLDSTGKSVGSSVYVGSGSSILDAVALSAAAANTYAPATFMCAPIVGSYLFVVEFR